MRSYCTRRWRRGTDEGRKGNDQQLQDDVTRCRNNPARLNAPTANIGPMFFGQRLPGIDAVVSRASCPKICPQAGDPSENVDIM